MQLCVPALLSSALIWPALADFTQSGPKLAGTGAGGNAHQGNSVALSADGNTLMVGGPNDSNNAGGGAAWVFTRSGGVWTQQGSKLAGSGAVGNALQGWSVALSADGNTAILGGYLDSGGRGAAWVFTRSGGVWTQQGSKLVGNDSTTSAVQGWSVALSADGNTAIVGGYGDNTGAGAAWVYTRSGGVWTQQGGKLVGTGTSGANQGHAVALSADGNTALVGGPSDSGFVGAAWVFTRSGGVWAQQGNKLVGTGVSGTPGQGFSVALSPDGNTAILGGNNDNGSAGAAWVFTRGGTLWTQQGSKLVGTGGVGTAVQQGISVALSNDGNTAIVGGHGDSNFTGAAWVFRRSGGVWTQQGNKLVGTGASGQAQQGIAVALSCNTAILGGNNDNSAAGAAWVFVAPSTAPHDFNNDCVSDILLENTGGGIAMWLMGPNATVQSAIGVGATTFDVWAIIGQRDLNGDGSSDILFRATDGSLAEWLMDGGVISSAVGLGNPTTAWNVVGTGDFNKDGIGDILFRGGGTAVAICYMSGTGAIGICAGVGSLTSDWTVAGTGDFNRDGVSDILWFNSNSGGVAIWLMNTNGAVGAALAVGALPAGWSIAGVGDFDGDSIRDILLSNSGNGVAIWFMNSSGSIASAQGAGTMAPGWTIAQTGDFNGDGKSDILWYHSASGMVGAWLMNGATATSFVGIGAVPPTSWLLLTANSD